MGHFWDLIERHRERQPYPPSYRQIAQRLGVAQNTFESWKRLRALPKRETIEAVARLTGISYHAVLEAALEDARYRTPPSLDREDPEPDPEVMAAVERTRRKNGQRGSASDREAS